MTIKEKFIVEVEKSIGKLGLKIRLFPNPALEKFFDFSAEGASFNDYYVDSASFKHLLSSSPTFFHRRPEKNPKVKKRVSHSYTKAAHIFGESDATDLELTGLSRFLHYSFKRYHSQKYPDSVYLDVISTPIEYKVICLKKELIITGDSDDDAINDFIKEAEIIVNSFDSMNVNPTYSKFMFMLQHSEHAKIFEKLRLNPSYLSETAESIRKVVKSCYKFQNPDSSISVKPYLFCLDRQPFLFAYYLDSKMTLDEVYEFVNGEREETLNSDEVLEADDENDY